MMALDENVVVRYLAQNDEAQVRFSVDLIKGCTNGSPGLVRRKNTVELVWVLERSYKYQLEKIGEERLGPVTASQLSVKNVKDIASTVNLHRGERYKCVDIMVRQVDQRVELSNKKTVDKKLKELDVVELLRATH